MKFEKDQIYTIQRTFSKAEVFGFSELAQYVGKHHAAPNEEGEYMVQGLLTGMLPGWIGGEYDIIAYGMDFQFLKPVYTGDHLTCKIVIEDVYEKNQKERIQFSYSIENGSKEIVLKGNMLGTPYIEN